MKKSMVSKSKTQMKDLSVNPRRSKNKCNDHGARLKPMELHENVGSFLKPPFGSECVPNMSKSALGTEVVKKHKNINESCRRKDHKQKNFTCAESRCKDSAKGADQNFESVQKNHLNLALEKKRISGKISDKTSFEPVKKSCVYRQVTGKDRHLTQDLSQRAVLGLKGSFSKCLKEEYVSEWTASQFKHKAGTRQLPMQTESRIKTVVKRKHADKLSNHVAEQGMINTRSNVQKVITANRATLLQVKAVKTKRNMETAKNLKPCQPQVCEYNDENMKTSQKSSPCDTEVDASCGSIASSMCTGIHGGNTKTKDGNQDPGLHKTGHFTSTDKKKVTTKATKLFQSEIIENCSRNFTSLDHCYAEIILDSDDKKLSVNDSGPSKTEIIESHSKTKDFGLLQIETTGVDSGSQEDAFRNLSLNQKSSKSNAVLRTTSAKSKLEETHARTSKKLQSKSNHEKDSDKNAQSQERLGGRRNFYTRKKFDAKHNGNISLDTRKTGLAYTNSTSTDFRKNQNDKIPCSKTKNETETDKPEVLTKDSMRLESSKDDVQQEKNCCNTAVAQIEATVFSFNSFPVTDKPVVNAANNQISRSSNHDDTQHVTVSSNICSSAIENQMKEDPHVNVHAEHKMEGVFGTDENSLCHPVSQLTGPRDIDLKELLCLPSLMAVDDSIVSRNEHSLLQVTDGSSVVKSDNCISSDVSKNDCSVTRSDNFCLLDCSKSSNSELSDCGHLLSIEVINSNNNNCSNKAISPIRSPSPHSSSSPSSKVDHRQYVNCKPLRLKEPVDIPLMVKDPKVRNLLEYMCKAEILRLLTDD